MQKFELSDHWREKLDIGFGMSKQEAFDHFIEWRTNKKTCQRCEGEKLVEYCQIHLICKEADDVRDVERNDNRNGVRKVNESKTLRTELSSERKRTAVRQIVREEESVP